MLLLDYDKASNRISMRHYSVAVAPSGVSKNLKQLLARKGLPDMGRMADVAEFLTRSAYGSVSEQASEGSGGGGTGAGGQGLGAGSRGRRRGVGEVSCMERSSPTQCGAADAHPPTR